MRRIPTSSSLRNRKLPIVSFIVFGPVVSRGSQTHATPSFHCFPHTGSPPGGAPFGWLSAARFRSRGHRSRDGGGDQPRDMTDLLISAHDLVLLGDRSLSVWLPGDENGVVHLEQTFTGHAMKSSSCLFALKLIVVYQRHYVTHANLLFPVRRQAK